MVIESFLYIIFSKLLTFTFILLFICIKFKIISYLVFSSPPTTGLGQFAVAGTGEISFLIFLSLADYTVCRGGPGRPDVSQLCPNTLLFSKAQLILCPSDWQVQSSVLLQHCHCPIVSGVGPGSGNLSVSFPRRLQILLWLTLQHSRGLIMGSASKTFQVTSPQNPQWEVTLLWTH